MEPIFAQLSLEYLVDGKALPWNKAANLVPNPTFSVSIMPHEIVSVPKPKRSYFSL